MGDWEEGVAEEGCLTFFCLRILRIQLEHNPSLGEVSGYRISPHTCDDLLIIPLSLLPYYMLSISI